jgi:integrase/recombinase XerD
MNKMEPLTAAELLNVLRLAKLESDRDHAMLLICYGHAMRASECGSLLLSDVSVKDQTLIIKRAKGSLDTVEKLMPNSNRLLDERKTLANWLRLRPTDSPYLFPSRKHSRLSRVQVHRIYRYYALKAGLPGTKLGVHALKHSIGQHGHDRGIDIEVLRVIMGHKLITSTQRYFEVTQAQADSARHAAVLGL